MAPQLHLALNHFPIVGFALLCPILLVAWMSKNTQLKLMSLAFVTGVGLLALPAFWTGEPAEKTIEHMAGVSEDQIERHEDVAKSALLAALATAALAAGLWFAGRRRESLLGLGVPAVLLACVGTTAIMARAGHEGGKIRHPEIDETTSEHLAPDHEPEGDHDEDHH